MGQGVELAQPFRGGGVRGLSLDREQPGSCRLDEKMVLVGETGPPQPGALRRLRDLDGAEARLYTFDAEAAPLDGPADSLRFEGVRTDIAGALQRVEQDLDGQNLGGVFLISDGRYNTGRNPIYLAERYDVPIYTTVVGDTTRQRDVLVARVTTNELAYAGVELPVQVAVRADGYEGERATVSLFERDQRLASQSVTLPEGSVEATVDLSFTPETPGLHRYTVAVSRFDGEATYGNNTESVAVRVLSNRRRVLLLAAAPGPDVSALRQVLETDPNLEVVPFTQKGPGAFYEGSLPTSLEDFDAAILAGFPGRAADRTAVQRVAAAAEGGLPLLFVLTRQTDLPALRAGFGDVLPAVPEVVRTGFTEAALVPTSAGALHPVLNAPTAPPSLLDRLPPVVVSDSRWAASPDARVLATTRVRGIAFDDPLLLVRQRGRSRSAALLAAGTWRWLNLPADLAAVEDFYPGLVDNLLRWLTTREDDRPVRVRPVQPLLGEGEAVQFTGQVYDESLTPIPDASVEVRVTAPDGSASPFVMRPLGGGRYVLDAGTLPEGDYTFTATAEREGAALGEDRGAFAVGALAVEFRDTQADAALMRGLARRSGGTTVAPEDLPAFPARLAAEGRFEPRVVERETETELWEMAGWLALVIVLLSAEWVLRKRAGMV